MSRVAAYVPAVAVAPRHLQGRRVRVVHVGLAEVKLAALGRTELLQHRAVERHDQHAGRLVLCERQPRLAAVLEAHDAMDVGLEPLVRAEQRPCLEVGADGAEAVARHARVDDAGLDVLVEAAMHVLLERLGVLGEGFGQLDAPREDGVALARRVLHGVLRLEDR